MKKYKSYKFKYNIKNPDLFLYFPKYYINIFGTREGKVCLKTDRESVEIWDGYLNRFLKSWRGGKY